MRKRKQITHNGGRDAPKKYRRPPCFEQNVIATLTRRQKEKIQEQEAENTRHIRCANPEDMKGLHLPSAPHHTLLLARPTH